MPSRKLPGEKKKCCGITFKIPIDLTFSVSISQKDGDDFGYCAGNNNLDASKVLREIVFQCMHVKNKKEFDDLMEKPINLGRSIVFEKMNVDKKHPFSMYVSEGMYKYMKRNKI